MILFDPGNIMPTICKSIFRHYFVRTEYFDTIFILIHAIMDSDPRHQYVREENQRGVMNEWVQSQKTVSSHCVVGVSWQNSYCKTLDLLYSENRKNIVSHFRKMSQGCEHTNMSLINAGKA